MCSSKLKALYSQTVRELFDRRPREAAPLFKPKNQFAVRNPDFPYHTDAD
jgi:hypothetical protein